MEVFEIESQEVADKDVASPKVSIFGDRIHGDRKVKTTTMQSCMQECFVK